MTKRGKTSKTAAHRTPSAWAIQLALCQQNEIIAERAKKDGYRQVTNHLGWVGRRRARRGREQGGDEEIITFSKMQKNVVLEADARRGIYTENMLSKKPCHVAREA